MPGAFDRTRPSEASSVVGDAIVVEGSRGGPATRPPALLTRLGPKVEPRDAFDFSFVDGDEALQRVPTLLEDEIGPEHSVSQIVLPGTWGDAGLRQRPTQLGNGKGKERAQVPRLADRLGSFVNPPLAHHDDEGDMRSDISDVLDSPACDTDDDDATRSAVSGDLGDIPHRYLFYGAEDTFSALRSFVVTYGRRVNALSPIHSLPDDLLLHISIRSTEFWRSGFLWHDESRAMIVEGTTGRREAG